MVNKVNWYVQLCLKSAYIVRKIIDFPDVEQKQNFNENGCRGKKIYESLSFVIKS